MAGTQNEVLMVAAVPRYTGQARGPSAQDGLTVMLEGATVPRGLSIPCCRRCDTSGDALKEV